MNEVRIVKLMLRLAKNVTTPKDVAILLVAAAVLIGIAYFIPPEMLTTL